MTFHPSPPRPTRGPRFLLLLLALLPVAWLLGGGEARGTGGRGEAGVPDRAVSEAGASQGEGEGGRAARMLGWSGFAQGGAAYQFSGRGSGFGLTRLFIETGVSYAPDPLRSFSLAVGYGFDAFDFSGGTGLARLRPWSFVHDARVSAPVRWGLDARWTLFLIPTVRGSMEDGAAVNDSFQGGGFAGFSYRFSDRLTLGPGVGVLSEIEDSPTVFPVLLVDWKITERLRLATGRGAGATLGPGLAASYRVFEKGELFLGGRYEKLRFRLNARGPSPGGVGEDRSFPLYGGVTYRFYPMGRVSLAGGVDLAQELRLEDARGNLLFKEFFDPAGFFGLDFGVRF